MRYRKLPAFRVRGSRRALLVSGAVSLVVLLVVLPVEVPRALDVPGRVFPAQEWVVARTPDGAVSAALQNHRTGEVEATYTAQPMRGDAVRFRLRPTAGYPIVLEGDTVGVFESGEAARLRAAVAGDIEAARARLALHQAGAKEAVIEVARQEARRADEALAYASDVYARQAALAERGVVASQETEAADNARRLAEAEAAAAQARYDDARTGAQAEQIALVQAEIAALEAQARSLAERAQLSTLVAPFSGQALRVFSRDTLLVVADTSAYLVAMPVPWAERARVAVGQPVAIRTAGGVARARIVDLRSTPVHTAGQPYLMGMAEVESGREVLVPGQLARCAIELDAQPPLAVARAFARSLFRW